MNNMRITHFFPGGEWLYLEVSANWHILDIIISNFWSDYVDDMLVKHLIKEAYFIRYFDKLPHLRLRFLLVDPADIFILFDSFKERISSLMEMSYIWDIRIATYKREHMRYHIDLMERTEHFFCLDSKIIAKVISESRRYAGDKARVLASMLLVDSYLNLFGYNLSQKRTLLSEMALSCKHAYKFTEKNSKQFNWKFREYKFFISDLLNRSSKDPLVLHLRDILAGFGEELKAVIAPLLDGIAENSLDKNDLLKSYIHMSFNRLFIARNQIYELLIYDFLLRYYLGQIAQITQMEPNV